MPPARAATKWDPDPEDPSVRRWRENLTRGSAATGDAWFRALRRFCAESHTTAQEVLKLKPKALRDLFMDFAAADEKRGAGGSYTAYTLKVAKNWLRFNGISPPAGVKVKAADTVFEETALSPEQLRGALNAATPRASVAMVLIAQSGIRPEVIGSFDGTDGLRFRDLPELEIDGRTVRTPKTPMVVIVRPELSKASHRYVTFLGAEGTRIVSDFAQSRLSGGEKIGPDSAVFPPERPDLSKRNFVRTTKIGSIIRHAFRTAGLPDRPYVLRTTAASRFAEAENRGLVPHSFWQHWMGHSGDMSARYSVNRGRIPQSLIEEMRAAYKRCEKHLASIPTSADENEGVQKVLRALLASKGMPPAEAEKLDIGATSDSELEALFKKYGVSAEPIKRSEKAFPVDDVPKLLEAGWEFVAPLNGSMAVLRSP
jgi:integrase